MNFINNLIKIYKFRDKFTTYTRGLLLVPLITIKPKAGHRTQERTGKIRKSVLYWRNPQVTVRQNIPLPLNRIMVANIPSGVFGFPQAVKVVKRFC